jgi:hypothetical protein
MPAKAKVIVLGILLLVISIFLYFTVRFKYIEQDYIADLITITNDIVREYNDTEKITAENKRQITANDLSDYLKYIHRKFKDIALIAITDQSLSVRLSSKNDSFIRSADLYEEILKDFTQDRFNISKNRPYVIRYYDEKTGMGVKQHKFYIFLSKIGQYRLLTVYPYHFGKKILFRTSLELSLIILMFIIITASVYIALAKRAARPVEPGHDAIEPGPEVGPPQEEGGAVSVETPQAAPASLPGPMYKLFGAVYRTVAADSISLYICRSSGMLVKSMELKGGTFFKDDSISADAIDINNEAGIELRKSSTLVLDDGRKIILPLIYDNIFLGTVNIISQSPITGNEIQHIGSEIHDMLKQVYDFIFSAHAINDID